MPTKIRLQRKGKKGQPFYHLVVADGRAPRDGRFIERLGTYNPMTHPATIEIDFDRALYWVQVGAQPTDTARSILSHKGVLLKHHLLKGVTKGALSEEQVEEKFKSWLNEKEEKLSRISKDMDLTEKERIKQQLEEEKKINEARAAELAKKRASEKMAARPAVEEEAAEEVAEAPADEVLPANEVITPEAPAVATEVPAEEAEAPAAVAAEESVNETEPAEEKEAGEEDTKKDA
jgi:small subunit ribosomal protein S16